MKGKETKPKVLKTGVRQACRKIGRMEKEGRKRGEKGEKKKEEEKQTRRKENIIHGAPKSPEEKKSSNCPPTF